MPKFSIFSLLALTFWVGGDHCRRFANPKNRRHRTPLGGGIDHGIIFASGIWIRNFFALLINFWGSVTATNVDWLLNCLLAVARRRTIHPFGFDAHLQCSCTSSGAK